MYILTAAAISQVGQKERHYDTGIQQTAVIHKGPPVPSFGLTKIPF